MTRKKNLNQVMSNPRTRKIQVEKWKAKKKAAQAAEWEATMKQREAMFEDNRVERVLDTRQTPD